MLYYYCRFFDDFPNLREFLKRKDEKLPPNHILLI